MGAHLFAHGDRAVLKRDRDDPRGVCWIGHQVAGDRRSGLPKQASLTALSQAQAASQVVFVTYKPADREQSCTKWEQKSIRS